MLLGIYPKELKTYIHTENCTQVSVAALFIIAKTWKQARSPSVSEWIWKLWYITTTEYYSVLKKEISYQARKSHGTTLNTYHSVKEASLKVCILCDSHYMTFWKRQNFGDCKKISSWPELGRGRDEQAGQTQWIFRAVHQLVKNPPAMQEIWVRSLSWEDSLEKGKATYSSILAWRFPRTIQSMGSQRVRHDWVTFTHTSVLINALLW